MAGGLNDSRVGYGLSAELRLLCMSAACLDWVYLCNVIDRISLECCLDPLQFPVSSLCHVLHLLNKENSFKK